MIIPASIVAASELRKPAEVAAKRSSARRSSSDRALLAPDALAQERPSPSELIQRAANLTFAGAKPSVTELERLIGSNDLVDEFYLERALEFGYAGFCTGKGQIGGTLY